MKKKKNSNMDRTYTFLSCSKLLGFLLVLCGIGHDGYVGGLLKKNKKIACSVVDGLRLKFCRKSIEMWVEG